MSLVKIKRRNEKTKNRELRISDHFRPIVPGSGAKIKGPTKPPTGRMLPIHESCSDVGIKSKGESDKSFVIFAIAGDDQPIEVPQQYTDSGFHSGFQDSCEILSSEVAGADKDTDMPQGNSKDKENFTDSGKRCIGRRKKSPGCYCVKVFKPLFPLNILAASQRGSKRSSKRKRGSKRSSKRSSKRKRGWMVG